MKRNMSPHKAKMSKAAMPERLSWPCRFLAVTLWTSNFISVNPASLLPKMGMTPPNNSTSPTESHRVEASHA